jgi:hypothetical protein
MSELPSGAHSAENPTRSQRRPVPQEASLEQAVPAAPVPPAMHVRLGPQYDPGMQSSLRKHATSLAMQLQGAHTPALQCRSARQVMVSLHVWPTPTPGAAASGDVGIPPSGSTYTPPPDPSHATASTSHVA